MFRLRARSRSRTSLGSLEWPVLLLAPSVGLAGCLEEENLDPVPLEEPSDLRNGDHTFPTKDVGTVKLGTGQVFFMVSENSDDDDENDTPDNVEALRPGEDNLRQFEFSPPAGATHVYVGEPYMTASGSSALDVAVNGWDATVDSQGAMVSASRFSFNELHPLPLTLHLDGVDVTALEGFAFEWQYYDGKTPLPEGGLAVGTVVNITAKLDVSDEFYDHDKILIRREVGLHASASPDISNDHRWGFTNGSSTVKDATSKSTLGQMDGPSWGPDANVFFDFRKYGHSIRAEHPFFGTVPRRLRRLAAPGWFDSTTLWFGLGLWTPTHVEHFFRPSPGAQETRVYEVVDQYGELISDSDWGGLSPHLALRPGDPSSPFYIMPEFWHHILANPEYGDIDPNDGRVTFNFGWMDVPSDVFMTPPWPAASGWRFPFYVTQTPTPVMNATWDFILYPGGWFDPADPANGMMYPPELGGGFDYGVSVRETLPDVYEWRYFWKDWVPMGP